jgi:hypothetical protein
MFDRFTPKPRLLTPKWMGMIFVAMLILGALAASDALPSSAAIAAGTVPPGGTAPPGSDIYLPIINATCRGTRARRAPTVFGVQMYGDTSDASKYFQDMVEINASWMRVEISWRRVEPVNVTPDQFNWDSVDKAFAASTQGGVNIIGTINYNPAWAAQRSQGPIDPEHLSDFGQFVAALVERYDGDGFDDDPCGRVVTHWEFYNEPDGRSRWGHEGDKYANMLATIYPLVKQANPEAKVLLGGLAYDWFEEQNGSFVYDFLPDVLAAGGGDYFDIMAFHAYPAFAGFWADRGPGLAEKSAAIRTVLADYGREKPLMITESGAHSNDAVTSPSTPEIQASYVVELYTQAKAADVDVVIGCMLYDPPPQYIYMHGLVTDGAPSIRKLAYSTYQQSVEQLADAVFDRKLTDNEVGDPDMFAYRFTKPDAGTALYVVWMNPANTDRTAQFTFSATQATVHDIFTNSYTILERDDGNQDGQLTLTVGRQPLLIEVER